VGWGWGRGSRRRYFLPRPQLFGGAVAARLCPRGGVPIPVRSPEPRPGGRGCPGGPEGGVCSELVVADRCEALHLRVCVYVCLCTWVWVCVRWPAPPAGRTGGGRLPPSPRREDPPSAPRLPFALLRGPRVRRPGLGSRPGALGVPRICPGGAGLGWGWAGSVSRQVEGLCPGSRGSVGTRGESR